MRSDPPPVHVAVMHHPAPSPVDAKGRLPSVLTSDVHNEAELIFSILEDPEWKCVSLLDVLTLLRGMGMNPIQHDMDFLKESMAGPIAALEAQRIEEEKKREKERKRDDKGVKGVDPKRAGGKAPPGRPTAAPASREGGSAAPGAGGGTDDKTKVPTVPQEEKKNIDWTIFINHIEPIFRDNHIELEDIMDALAVFDTKKTGRMTRERLAQIVTSNGESVLSPAEVKQLADFLPEEADLREIAQRLQGTYVAPPPVDPKVAAPPPPPPQEADDLLADLGIAPAPPTDAPPSADAPPSVGEL